MIPESEEEELFDTSENDEEIDERLRQNMQSNGLNCTSKTISTTQPPTKNNKGSKKNTQQPRTNKTVEKNMPDGSIQSSSRNNIAPIPASSSRSTKGNDKKRLRAK